MAEQRRFKVVAARLFQEWNRHDNGECSCSSLQQCDVVKLRQIEEVLLGVEQAVLEDVLRLSNQPHPQGFTKALQYKLDALRRVSALLEVNLG